MASWYPRPSSVGAFVACDYRAALERVALQGLDPEAADAFEASKAKPSPYADFGTCVHRLVMEALGAELVSRADEPLPWESAATVFGGTVEAAKKQARMVAAVALGHFPTGMAWRCEVPLSCELTRGTADFVSVDGTWLGDLKTTSKPVNDTPKPEHVYQLALYWHMLGRVPQKLFIVYVSTAADFGKCVLLDPTGSDFHDFADNVVEYLKYLSSPEIFDRAIQRIGPHCSDLWCPFQHLCKHRIIVPLTRKGITTTSLDAVFERIPS